MSTITSERKVAEPEVPAEVIEAFEKRYRHQFDLTRDDHEWRNTWRYKHDHIQSTWAGWRDGYLARKSLASPVGTEAEQELAKLVEYFRGEGFKPFGHEGDYEGWTAAETAIRAMRKLASLSAPAPGVTEALRKTRNTFRVKYDSEGKPASVSYDSEALRPLVAMLDAALSSTPSDAGKMVPAEPEGEWMTASFLAAIEDAHKTLMNTLDDDFGFWSSPVAAKVRNKIYPLWKRLSEGLPELRKLSAAPSPLGEPVAWAWELQLNGHGPGHTYLAVEKPEFAPADLPLVRNLRPLYTVSPSLRAEAIETTHAAIVRKAVAGHADEFTAGSVVAKLAGLLTDKEVYNGLTYLARAGELTRNGYGRYIRSLASDAKGRTGV